MTKLFKSFLVIALLIHGGSSLADERADEFDRLEASSSDGFVPAARVINNIHPLFVRMATHYNMRIYQKGNQVAIQIDLKNIGTLAGFGPHMSVNLKGIGYFPDAAMYPYWGGNVSKANTIFPGDLGYIPLTLPAGVRILQGQAVDVTITPAGQSNFQQFGGTMIGCPKGTLGCE